MTGFVYTGHLTEGELQRFLQEHFPNAVRLSWDLARLDFSDDLREAGLCFTAQAEARWSKGPDGYRVLILSDQEISLPQGFQPVGGAWETEESATRLLPLPTPQFAPQFSEYPGGWKGGRLRCRAFRRNGTVVFLSPREVIPDASA